MSQSKQKSSAHVGSSTDRAGLPLLRPCVPFRLIDPTALETGIIEAPMDTMLAVQEFRLVLENELTAICACFQKQVATGIATTGRNNR